MRANIPIASILLTLTGAVHADDSIAPATLEAIKRAAVFIRVETRGLEGSGSGFVMARDGQGALIVTNYHVVAPSIDVDSAGPNKKPRGKQQPGLAGRPGRFRDVKITAVFDSNARTERAAAAEVIASDPGRDLAVLRVTGVKDLPVPVDYTTPVAAVETMPLYTLGFPFGRALATSSGGPAITVAKASVSSLRRNDNGELAIIQIDGSLNPGNSGGPVIDARGRLVGVAVATIKDSSGIGLIIPAQHLRDLLEGRLANSEVVLGRNSAGKTIAHVAIPRIDPLKKIRFATLHYVVMEAGMPKPRAGQALRRHPSCRSLPLTLENLVARADIPIEGTAAHVVLEVEALYEFVSGEIGETIIGRHELGGVAMPASGREPVGGDAEEAADAGRIRLLGPEVIAEVKEIVREANRSAAHPDDAAGGRTGLVGGGFGRDPFQDVAPSGAVLVGLEVGLGKFFDMDVVHSLRAVFRADKTESLGEQRGTNLERVVRLVARPGYAVGALTVKSGANADGLSITFMRLKDGRLDAADSYESDWVGDTRPGGKKTLSGDGKPILGIFGTQNAKNVTGIGLLLDRPGRPAPPTARPDDAAGGRTGLVGGGFGRDPFRDVAPPGAVLVGLEVGLGKFFDIDVLHSLRAVFRADKTESLGEQRGTNLERVVRLVARPGYAVGALTVKSGANADGLSITFMRLKDGRLDAADSYESDWVGDTRPGGKKTLSGDGKPILGIFGTQNAKNVTGIGLVLDRPGKPAPPAARKGPPSFTPVEAPLAPRIDDFTAGFNALEDNQLDRAIDRFTAAIRAQPSRTVAYLLRGGVWGLKKEFDKAESDFATALKVDKECTMAWRHLAELSMRKGDIDKAIADVSEGLKALGPSRKAERFLIFRGHLHHKKKEYQKAIADYSAAIDMNPSSADAYSGRASAHRPLRQYAKVIADDEEAIRLAPDHHGPYTDLAWLLATCVDARFRDGKKALEYAKRACELTKYKDANDLENLAAAHAELGNFTEAVKWQAKAIELADYYGEPSLRQARLRLKLFGEKKPYRDETDDETIVPKDAPPRKKGSG